MLFLGIMDDIRNGWRSLLLSLNEAIYKLIVYLYNLFEAVGTADILNGELINVIFRRFELILGIYMLFRLLFSFIQMLINPDYISDNDKGIGNIAKKSILVIALLGVMPAIFTKAMEFQNFIVGTNGGENVIAKLIIPYGSKEDFGDFGSFLSSYLFVSFYNYDDRLLDRVKSGDVFCSVLEEQESTPKMTILQNRIISSKGSLTAAYGCLNDKEFVGSDNVYTISFTKDGVWAIVVGVFVCWILFSYTLAVGVRVIQLVFLRIISPIPILGYLSPKKDGIFESWIKMCISTYIDLFIRMGIIYFIISLISILIHSLTGDIVVSSNYTGDVRIIKVVLIIALLMFAKKAPELLKKLFPSNGFGTGMGFGLTTPKKLLGDMLGGQQLWNFGKRSVGFAAGGLAGGAIGFLGGRGLRRFSGGLAGVGRGALNGAKKGSLLKNLQGVGTKQRQVNKRKIDWKNSGSTFGGRMGQRMATAFGFRGAAEKIEDDISKYDIKGFDYIDSITGQKRHIDGLKTLNAKSAALKEISDAVGKMEDRATSQLDTKTFKPNQTYQRNLQNRRRNYKAISEALSNGDVEEARRIVSVEYNRAREESNSIIEAARQKLESGQITREQYDKETAYAYSQKDRIANVFAKLQNGNYTFADAEGDLTDTLTETRNEFITQSLKVPDGDSVIHSSRTRIQEVFTHPDNNSIKSYFVKVDDNGDTVNLLPEDVQGFMSFDYGDLDNISGMAKGANTTISDDIYRLQTAKEALANSERKQVADANRNAVGGHSGGN